MKHNWELLLYKIPFYAVMAYVAIIYLLCVIDHWPVISSILENILREFTEGGG
jgi:hypothetical protein